MVETSRRARELLLASRERVTVLERDPPLHISNQNWYKYPKSFNSIAASGYVEWHIFLTAGVESYKIHALALCCMGFNRSSCSKCISSAIQVLSQSCKHRKIGIAYHYYAMSTESSSQSFPSLSFTCLGNSTGKHNHEFDCTIPKLCPVHLGK